MRAFVVGTAGHVDHGKTALVRALTGVETDRWKEEQERGLTIDLGFASLPLDSGAEASVVDVPGHEDFVKNMLAGATGIDLLLLVVAADEGPMPQTREHLAIAHHLGIRRGVVALSKADRVEAEWLELSREAVRDELAVFGASEWPIVSVSAVTGAGLDRLRGEIDRHAASLSEVDSGDHFRLPVDRSFSVPGAGTVVTGTVWSGAVSVGDEVEVLPAGRKARVRSLQVHSEARRSVGPRRRCAAALVGLDAATVPRGSVVVGGTGWRVVRKLGVRLAALPQGRRTIEAGQRVRLYLGTREVMARVDLRSRGTGPSELAPGQEAWAALALESPVVARAGDHFVIRFYSPVTTIGGGRVAELAPPDPWLERTGDWEAVLATDSAAGVAAAVSLAGREGADVDELAMATGLPTAGLRELLEAGRAPLIEIGGRWFADTAARAAADRVLAALQELHELDRRAPAASREAVRASAVREFAPVLVEWALSRLESSGQVVAEGPEVRLVGHRPVLTGQEEALKGRLCELIDAGGFEPPAVGALGLRLAIADDVLHDLLRLLARDGHIRAITPDLYLSRANEARLRDVARGLSNQLEVVTPSDFKGRLGVTRKYLIPLLEHLDRAGVTRRVEGGRVWVGEIEPVASGSTEARGSVSSLASASEQPRNTA